MSNPKDEPVPVFDEEKSETLASLVLGFLARHELVIVEDEDWNFTSNADEQLAAFLVGLSLDELQRDVP